MATVANVTIELDIPNTCPQHHLPLDIMCQFDLKLICTECAGGILHQSHDPKISVSEFALKTNK